MSISTNARRTIKCKELIFPSYIRSTLLINQMKGLCFSKKLKPYIIRLMVFTPAVLYILHPDYSGKLQINENSFDIMFSFYAGFISQACKKYLRDDGILVCNNSHGDASIAYTDGDYSLISVVKRNGDSFSYK